jgi:uncharacterized protein YbjT (DUF2867 family)
MKSILITGATGFLGKHLVEQLKAAEPDSSLRLLCRRPSASESGPIEITPGDVTSREGVLRAAEGVTEIASSAEFVGRSESFVPSKGGGSAS